MNLTYLKAELFFEKMTAKITQFLGSTIAFVLALITVLFWWSIHLFISEDWYENIGDFIFGFTFLSLFIIQKSFNRYSALVLLKMNILISLNEKTNNSSMNTSQKTESEIRMLSGKYFQEKIQEKIEKIIKEKEDK